MNSIPFEYNSNSNLDYTGISYYQGEGYDSNTLSPIIYNEDTRSKDYEEIKEICNKFQEDSLASDMEVKTLLRELARVWEKDIDENYDIDWEV